MLDWLLNKTPNKRLKELAEKIEIIDALITANTEAFAQKKLEL